MTSRTQIMGIVNVTPDSFSDGGQFATTEAAVSQARALVSQGADIVDIGGESTRPGATPVPRAEELARILPVVRDLAALGHSISIDTLHAETARAAVAAGARLINDVSGGLHDPDMVAVAAEASRTHGARYLIGHWRGVPDPAQQRSNYGDVVAEVRDVLGARADAAVAAGVDPTHIVVDPGLGFDKTGEQGWQLLAHLESLRSLGYPVLVGASRKRMIAEALTRGRGTGASTAASIAARDVATAVTSALAAGAGAWGVRVHDVETTVLALAVAEAWEEGRQGPAPETRKAQR
ncbi:dihydropteroate synthase [Leucobacter insecticola]|uniref:Dihydropteroate synthase n=1 Tax=Leucobacter insecticola TaxID=2714934 RepID=A0A6G8FLJ4_9MICO|nr:dihydropteroate synthase [Leucobacter insecticola]QIM17221.1 dihydropteroate synthase [Leucobacter insecticola]